MGEGRSGSIETTEAIGPAAGVMATARVKGSQSNLRGPIGCSAGSERRCRRRTGGKSDRPIVPRSG